MAMPSCPPQSAYPQAADSTAWNSQQGYYNPQQYADQESCQGSWHPQDSLSAQHVAQPTPQGPSPNQEQLRQQYEQMQQMYEQQCAEQGWRGQQESSASPEMSSPANSVYLPQPAMYGHMTKPIPQVPFHPGYQYAPGISVHYNYYEAAEYTARLEKDQQKLAAKQGEGEKEERKESGESQQEQALKPLFTSTQRLASGQTSCGLPRNSV
ncbi:hypothetical protein TGPRC2_266300 [Toxoplasma gondii TgCatPRC2]|uniref:Uncharacterized protein n=1 Tax=Toxoplasma gondii TgCatPRC2 TaxID=1130821 RepID=A0A151GZ23_TOXGO|nr:hypothetical protein TGPRC2_266300 [Toxoplasma gondii TgCatPRC2]